MAAANRSAFDAADTVRDYASAKDLQPPEATILAELRRELATARALDLGVGAGRTTRHLAPLVREYVGVDYSERMLSACRRAFPYRFLEADARDLSCIGGEQFDFVLFSYNGIDYVSHNDRLQVLSEIRRVCRSEGWFCLSTHNLLTLPVLFQERESMNPLVRWRERQRVDQVRAKNPPLEDLLRGEHAIVLDGAGHNRLASYYIHPLAQIVQLANAGFDGVRVFALSGEELTTNVEAITSCRDPWLYYLCRRQSGNPRGTHPGWWKLDGAVKVP